MLGERVVDRNCKCESFCIEIMFDAMRRDWMNNVASVNRTPGAEPWGTPPRARGESWR